jgi:hypothetical protein
MTLLSHASPVDVIYEVIYEGVASSALARFRRGGRWSVPDDLAPRGLSHAGRVALSDMA